MDTLTNSEDPSEMQHNADKTNLQGPKYTIQ